ncbi:nuclear transport factor 2 family protein [Subtercola sp. YIM 133946]|uniref:nuclear transport factor 2 family protein n=1 Tax=Subtercola sp. YIM 133946 TaxID=3118909 RepID=UPI002F92C11C
MIDFAGTDDGTGGGPAGGGLPFIDHMTVGLEHDARIAAAIVACQEVIAAFCDLLDQGDIDAAFALHSDDLEFWEVGASEPLRGPKAAAESARRFRFMYPGRRTLHVPSNFIIQPDGDAMRARYSMTVWELTVHENGVTRQLRQPQIFVLAQETAVLHRTEEGVWRISEERMFLVAPRRDLVPGEGSHSDDH